MITGLVDFNGKVCVFRLVKGSFDLIIEEIEERENIHFQSFSFQFSKEFREEVKKADVLIAKDFERGKIYHFHVQEIFRSAAKTFDVSLNSYIVFDGADFSFDNLQIQAEELNWFHNINLAFNNYSYAEDEEGQIQLKPFEKTKEEFEFHLKDNLIKGNLNIQRKVTKNSTSPLKLQSTLRYEFKETKDISLPIDLVVLTRQLLEFLSYRKNLHINRFVLCHRFENENYIIGNLFVKYSQSEEREKEIIIRKRIISYPLLNYSFRSLLEKIAMKKVYLKHIPETHRSSNIITSARFVMATAGFEWQFQISHKDLNEQNKNEKERNEMLDFLECKILETTGDTKRYFKGRKKFYLKNEVRLASKILWAFDKHDEVLKEFVESLYSRQDIQREEFEYKVIAERIQNDRNAIAHGNIEVEDNKLIDLDLSVLEWLYYAMVLEDIGVSKENAKRCINDLFGLGFNYW